MLGSKKDDFLKYLQGKHILITSHDLVDLDGFISGITLKFFFETIFSDQKIDLVFSGLTKNTKNFIRNFIQKFPDFNLSFYIDQNLLKVDVIIIVDSNNLVQLNLFNTIDLKIPFIFIDHHLDLHTNHKYNISSYNMIFDEYSSTSEIILELLNKYNIELPIPYIYLLTSAILADSGFLKYGNNKTIDHLNSILRSQVEIQEIIPLLESETEISEKIAQIKALQRVKLIRINDWLIGTTHLSSFSASGASILIRVGFDIGIVVSEEKGNFRITTRAKKKVCLTTGLHLGKILGEIDNVNGGGHDSAATLNGKGDAEKVLKQLTNKIKETLIN